jgi:hypothetical protein
MIRDAGRRSRAAFAIVSFVFITAAAACSGLALPGQSSGTSGVPAGSLPAVSIGSAADLEALLPDQLCGAPATKQSFSGTVGGPSGSANPYGDLIGALGGGSGAVAVVSPADENTCKVGAVAFQLTGANQAFLQIALQAMAAGSGGSAANTSVGGKTVIKAPDSDTTTYVYVKGDVVFVVEAPSDDLAAPVLSALP